MLHCACFLLVALLHSDPHSPMLAPCNKLSSTQLENGQRKQGVSATLDCHGEQGTPLPPVISLPAAQPPSTVNIAETTLQPVPRGLHSCISSSSSCNTSSSATTARKQEHTTAASTPASHLAPLQHQQQQEQQTPSLAALSGQRGRNKSSTSAAPPSWMSTTMFVLTSPPETSDSASSPGFGTEKFSERPAETPEKGCNMHRVFVVSFGFVRTLLAYSLFRWSSLASICPNHLSIYPTARLKRVIPMTLVCYLGVAFSLSCTLLPLHACGASHFIHCQSCLLLCRFSFFH